jgi:hypothetical protein
MFGPDAFRADDNRSAIVTQEFDTMMVVTIFYLGINSLAGLPSWGIRRGAWIRVIS